MRKSAISLIFISICFLATGLCSTAFAADSALVDAAKKEGKLVVYTSMPTEPAVALLAAFKKKYPFLDTSEFFRSTSYKVFSRFNIETEANKHIADIISPAVWVFYDEWKKKGWLMKYDSPYYKDIPKAVQDPGYYASLRAIAIHIAYNTSVLSKEEVPKTWTDLLDPKWKGLIGVEGADSGSQHQQYFLMKNAYGSGYWDKMLKNEPRIYGGQGALYTALLRGEIKVALHGLCYSTYRYRELEGAPIQGVFPKDFIPMYAAPLAISAFAPHPNAARLYMDWTLSKEGQEAMVKNVGAYSPRADVAPAKGNPPISSFKSVFIEDWRAFEQSTDEFKNTWNKLKR